MKEWTAAQIIDGIKTADVAEVDAVADKLGEILAGRHPGIQGLALAQTLALWLLGHEDPETREKLLAAHIESVRKLMAL
jgi:hypothetical protein